MSDGILCRLSNPSQRMRVLWDIDRNAVTIPPKGQSEAVLSRQQIEALQKEAMADPANTDCRVDEIGPASEMKSAGLGAAASLPSPGDDKPGEGEADGAGYVEPKISDEVKQAVVDSNAALSRRPRPAVAPSKT